MQQFVQRLQRMRQTQRREVWQSLERQVPRYTQELLRPTAAWTLLAVGEASKEVAFSVARMVGLVSITQYLVGYDLRLHIASVLFDDCLVASRNHVWSLCPTCRDAPGDLRWSVALDVLCSSAYPANAGLDTQDLAKSTIGVITAYARVRAEQIKSGWDKGPVLAAFAQSHRLPLASWAALLSGPLLRKNIGERPLEAVVHAVNQGTAALPLALADAESLVATIYSLITTAEPADDDTLVSLLVAVYQTLIRLASGEDREAAGKFLFLSPCTPRMVSPPPHPSTQRVAAGFGDDAQECCGR
jgi:hypothetical protein